MAARARSMSVVADRPAWAAPGGEPGRPTPAPRPPADAPDALARGVVFGIQRTRTAAAAAVARAAPAAPSPASSHPWVKGIFPRRAGRRPRRRRRDWCRGCGEQRLRQPGSQPLPSFPSRPSPAFPVLSRPRPGLREAPRPAARRRRLAAASTTNMAARVPRTRARARAASRRPAPAGPAGRAGSLRGRAEPRPWKARGRRHHPERRVGTAWAARLRLPQRGMQGYGRTGEAAAAEDREAGGSGAGWERRPRLAALPCSRGCWCGSQSGASSSSVTPPERHVR